MGFWEERWEKRQQETIDAARQAEEQAYDEAGERERREAELSTIFVSTLGTAPRPFEQADVIYGEPCADEASALLSLKESARAKECDAVLGVGFCPAATPGTLAAGIFAYGTGVRWTAPSR